MSKKLKTEAGPKEPYYPKSIETFLQAGDYELMRMKQFSEPSCFNSSVSVKKYRVTVEEIDEPIEIYKERLNKLWEECDNHHHYQPLLFTAKRMGIDLDRETFGKRRVPRGF